MITNPRHELDFGALDLTGKVEYAGGVRFYAMAAGATLGNAEQKQQELGSSLRDSTFVVIDSYGNRAPAFQVQIIAADTDLLAIGEGLLFAECMKQNRLRYVPADGVGAPTIFTVFTADPKLAFDDLDELRVVRAYELGMIAAAFGNSEDEVISVATGPAPITPTETVISDGSSTTGWTCYDNGGGSAASQMGVVTSVGGQIVISPNPVQTYWYGNIARAQFTLPATLDTTPTPYLSIDVDTSQIAFGTTFVNTTGMLSVFYPAAGSPGESYSPIYSSSLGPNLTRYTFEVRRAGVTSLRFNFPLTGNAQGTIGLDNLKRSDLPPNLGGGQSLRTINVYGSARTPASIAIEQEGAGLGVVYFYTCSELASGYSPSSRKYLVNGNATVPDASAVSGGYQTYDGTPAKTFDLRIPLSSLPQGLYRLVVRIKPSAATTFTATVSTRLGSADVAPVTLPATASIPAGAYQFIELGNVDLPTALSPAQSSSYARIQITAASDGAHQLDDVWPFFIGGDAAISQVDCGTGTPVAGSVFSRLWIDGPSLQNGGQHNFYAGTLPDRSDAIHPAATIRDWADHNLPPGASTLFVLTSNGGAGLTVTSRYTPAWLTFAQKLPELAA